MFPNGSPDLVEPIYKNPILLAPFNEQLAAVIQAYIQDRLQASFAGHNAHQEGHAQILQLYKQDCLASDAVMQ